MACLHYNRIISMDMIPCQSSHLPGLEFLYNWLGGIQKEWNQYLYRGEPRTTGSFIHMSSELTHDTILRMSYWHTFSKSCKKRFSIGSSVPLLIILLETIKLYPDPFFNHQCITIILTQKIVYLTTA